MHNCRVEVRRIVTGQLCPVSGAQVLTRVTRPEVSRRLCPESGAQLSGHRESAHETTVMPASATGQSEPPRFEAADPPATVQLVQPNSPPVDPPAAGRPARPTSPTADPRATRRPLAPPTLLEARPQ